MFGQMVCRVDLGCRAARGLRIGATEIAGTCRAWWSRRAPHRVFGEQAAAALQPLIGWWAVGVVASGRTSLMRLATKYIVWRYYLS
jgi:hypothetical protein